MQWPVSPNREEGRSPARPRPGARSARRDRGFVIVPQANLKKEYRTMSFTSWVRNLRSARPLGRAYRNRRQAPPLRAATRFRPRLEVLEDRTVPSTFNVTTTLDGVAGSLRQAVLAADASPGTNTINVPAGTYTLTQGGTAGDLEVTGQVTIRGAGAGVTVIDADFLDRAFHFLGGATVTLSGLTITNGQAHLFSGGGGILNEGTLTIQGSIVSGNSGGDSGGIGGGSGGGIANFGTLTVSDSTLSGNSADYGGGLFNAGNGTVTVNGSTLTGNSAAGDSGGGIANLGGPVTVSNSTLSGNSAYGGGGGISNFTTLTVSSSTLSGNSTRVGGGIWNDGTLTVGGSTLTGNSAVIAGGGIWNDGTLTVSGSTLTGNSAPRGGGISNDAGTLTVRDSTLSGNSAIQGGGIYNANEGLEFGLSGMLTIRGSIICGNSASQGGGIFNDFSGTLIVKDSTFSGNTATDFGGGIASFGALMVRDSTLLGNSAPLGGDLYNAGLVSLFDSIIGDRYDA
jgi:predicted outer membrane repeat protein